MFETASYDSAQGCSGLSSPSAGGMSSGMSELLAGLRCAPVPTIKHQTSLIAIRLPIPWDTPRRASRSSVVP